LIVEHLSRRERDTVKVLYETSSAGEPGSTLVLESDSRNPCQALTILHGADQFKHGLLALTDHDHVEG
jgi:hypothetical protein